MDSGRLAYEEDRALVSIERWADTHGHMNKMVTDYLSTIDQRSDDELYAFQTVLTGLFCDNLDERSEPTPTALIWDELLAFLSIYYTARRARIEGEGDRAV